MKINVSKFIEEFQLKPFGAKGWRNSKSIDCPYCGKGYDKFGILLLENGGVYKCFRCDTKGSIFSLLKKIDRKDLIIGNSDDYTYKEKLDSFLKLTEKTEGEINTKEIIKPPGFERIYFHEYLKQRGWVKNDYLKSEVGISTLPRFKNRIIFLVYEEGKLVAYLSRSLMPKEWHDENLKLAKQKLCKLIPRYDNSRETEFDNVVGGLDDIIEGVTKTVIIVEGIMDKHNVDRKLFLDEGNEVKCVYTFGCHLSIKQMYKIYEKGIDNIILMFDKETIKQTKSVSLNLLNYFNIFICELNSDKDPGDMSLQDFEKSLENLINPINYFANRLGKTVLK